MPAGRPTLYNQDLLEKARAWLEQERTLTADPDGKLKDIMPTIEGLALELGVSRDTIRKWGQDPEKPEFNCIYEALNAKQAQSLIYGGLTGILTSTVSKMMLGSHGYSDRVDSTNHHTVDFSGMSDEELEHIISGE